MIKMKNILRRLTVSVIFICCIIKLEAQEASAPNEIVTEFFSIYNEKGVDNALSYIFSTNDWMEQRSKDGISNVKMQLNSLVDLVGKYYGYEYITEKSIGKSFKLYSYLVKYDRQPIRFVFIFYKPNDKWMIYNFKYDQELAEELEDAAKAYRLKENFDF